MAKKKKRLTTWQHLLIFFAELLILLIVVVIWFVVDKLGKVGIHEIDREQIVVNIAQEVKDNETIKGYTNYLLLGSDVRENTMEAMINKGNGNTDAIIICSVNNDTKEVRLVSVYRDTLLMVPRDEEYNDAYRKATEAFFYSGIEGAINTVNVNLDLNIEEYVMVNFDALIRIIDAIGGIDITIDDNELYWINEYLRDTGFNTGRTYENVPNSGLVHLDGIQATAYCRIRYDKNLDYGRAERQRKVISLVFNKVKSTYDPVKLNNAIEGVLDNVVTNIPRAEILSMSKDVFSYSLVDQTGFPFEKFGSMKKVPEIDINDPVFAMDLKTNVSLLHAYLFAEDDYQPSKRLIEISDYLQFLYDKNNYPDNIY